MHYYKNNNTHIAPIVLWVQNDTKTPKWVPHTENEFPRPTHCSNIIRELKPSRNLCKTTMFGAKIKPQVIWGFESNKQGFNTKI